MLVVQGNLACTYEKLGRKEGAVRIRQHVYSGRLKLDGREHGKTILAANNYAVSLLTLERFEEARSLLRRTIPVARRVLGESNQVMLKMRSMYAKTLYRDTSATLDDLREAVATNEEIERIARRVLGSVHPTTSMMEKSLREAREVLRARETPSPAESA